MDGRAGGLTDGETGRSEEELCKHEEETEDAEATADEDGAEEENGPLEEVRRASNDVFGTCTRMAQSKMKPD